MRGGWSVITPDKHNDWLNHRDDSFDRFIAIGDKTNKNSTALFSHYSLGVTTNRDTWCFNSSRLNLEKNVKRMIATYQRELAKAAKLGASFGVDMINRDPVEIKWTRGLETAFKKGKSIEFEGGDVRLSLYRPFTKRWLYFSRSLNEYVCQIPSLFPESDTNNVAFDVAGAGSRWGFTVMMTKLTPELATVEQGQTFALWNRPKSAKYGGRLFSSDAASTSMEYSVTDDGLTHFRSHYKNEKITKEDIFYYVYGLLHSEQYRKKIQR